MNVLTLCSKMVCCQDLLGQTTALSVVFAGVRSHQWQLVLALFSQCGCLEMRELFGQLA